LLLSKKDWMSSLNIVSKGIEDFILVYDLVKDERIISIANKLSDELSVPIVSFSGKEGYSNWKGSFKEQGPKELIELFIKAKYVVTSSFHGTAFSIIFEKQFYTVPHPTRGSRMIDLLNSLGLEDRLIERIEMPLLSSQVIDFTESKEKLE